MKKQDGILEQIFDRIDTVAQVQQGIPQQLSDIREELKNRPDENGVRVIVRDEMKNCPAYQRFGEVADRTAENTGVLKTLRDTGSLRRSLAPAARAVNKVPKWIQATIAILGALGAAAAAVAQAMQ